MLKFGFSEALLLFAAAALWHNQILAMCVLSLACLTAFARFSLEWNQKTKEAELKAEASKLLNEQVQEVGDVLGTMFGKKKSTMH